MNVKDESGGYAGQSASAGPTGGRSRRPVWPGRHVALALLLLPAACGILEEEPRPVPTAEEAAAYYENHRGVREVERSGNVVELHIDQPARQLERGGSLWARVGPYIYLFSHRTRDLFEAFGGLAAVRVITYSPDGDEIARALLRRDAMNVYDWDRARALHSRALREGTDRPRRIEELVGFGEEFADYEYDPAYVPADR